MGSSLFASQKILITGRCGGAEALTQEVSHAMSHAMARWQSGYAAVCKTVYIGSIPVRASNTLQHDPVYCAACLLHSMSRGMKLRHQQDFKPRFRAGTGCGIDCRTYMLMQRPGGTPSAAVT